MKESNMKRHRGNAGFTLLDMMVGVAFLGRLLVLVGPRFIRGQEKAEQRAAAAQIANFGTALDTFRLDVGRYPTPQGGLGALSPGPGPTHVPARRRPLSDDAGGFGRAEPAAGLHRSLGRSVSQDAGPAGPVEPAVLLPAPRRGRPPVRPL